tara:strand:+ start:191 stop:1459 length:1269 start_codon:yes stop_codon:yes gene_type:complete
VIIRTRKISDKRLLSLCEKLFEIYPEGKVSGQYFGGVQFSAENLEEFEKLAVGSNEYLIEKFVFSHRIKRSDEVRFGRGVMPMSNVARDQPLANQFYRLREPDPYFDELAFFEIPNRQGIADYVSFSDQNKLEIARALSRLSAPVKLGNDKSSDTLTARLDQNIDDLSALSSKFLGRMAEARAQDEDAFKKRLEKLEEEFEQRNTQLVDERASLEALRKEINDREPQHERRRLREDLTSQLRDFLSPKEEGRAKWNVRSPYYLQAFVGCILFFLSAALTAQASFDNLVSEALWVSAIKSALLGAAGVAFAWAGLSGLKKSVSREDEFRREIQRYGYDMDRASWVVETILQMSSLEAQQIPDVWLQAVCEGLFASPEVQHTDERSLDALAALLDATAKARVGTNGFEFELDKRGLRTATKQAH